MYTVKTQIPVLGNSIIYTPSRTEYLGFWLRKSRIFWVFVVLLQSAYSVSCLAIEDRFEIKRGDVHDFECKAVVGRISAEFTFVGKAGGPKSLRWNRQGVSLNQLEHAWMIHVVGRIGAFDFGFYKYKTTAAEEVQGTMDKLLLAGQASVFRYTDGNAMEFVRLVPGEEVLLGVEEDDLRVFLKGENILLTLFADRPVSADFWILTAGEAPRKCRAKILYNNVQ